MRDRTSLTTWRPLAAGLVALLAVVGPAWGQQGSSASSNKEKEKETVVRTFGTEGGYRTEVTSKVDGKLSEEDRRQASLLTIEVFQHIRKAREGIDADEPKEALKHVNKALEAVKTIRTLYPKAIVRTKTTAPDGKTLFEDEYDVQDSRVPLYEAMLHSQTLAPILAARRNALQVAGFQVVESERVATEVFANLDVIEAQLKRASKTLGENKTEDAAKALGTALIRGIDFHFSKEDTELASARDAIWMARRSLEENNPAQALVNLATARQRLSIYRELLSQDQRHDVDQMLREVEQLEAQLRQENNRTITRAERARQGTTVTHWWDRVNSWFRRHL